MDDWVETPCMIERFEIVEERFSVNSPVSFRIDTLYTYEFAGQTFASEKVKRVDGATSHKARAEAEARLFPPGRAVCFVKPDAPQTAVLKKDTKAAGYTVWFPGLFVIGGLGIAINSIRKGTGRAGRDKLAIKKP
jgi:hypothetical protein